MGTGTLTLALLALSTSAVPGDVVPMNSRNFQIPIHIAEGQRSKIKELLLFASSDEGVTWNQVSAAAPDKDAFVELDHQRRIAGGNDTEPAHERACHNF